MDDHLPLTELAYNNSDIHVFVLILMKIFVLGGVDIL